MLRVVTVCAIALGYHLIVCVDAEQSFCSRPPDIDGLISPDFESEEYPVGKNISYRCKFGYVSRSSSSFISECRINQRSGKAEWTHLNVSCIPQSCGDPGYVTNGYRIGNLFTFPNAVETVCYKGYKIRGLKFRYCQVNGEWSGELPTCDPIHCPVPSKPKNGRVLYSSLDYGTKLQYECDKGFKLQNHQPRICNEEGIWSNSEAECIEMVCKKPEAPVHGSVQLSGEPIVGTLAIYSCYEGTTLVGATTSKCLISGDWTFDPPKCLRSCYVPDIPDGLLGRYERRGQYGTTQLIFFKAGEPVKPNEVAILHCRDGYSPGNKTSGRSTEVTCNDGKWSEPLSCRRKQYQKHPAGESCYGEPPAVKNGSPQISSREHGRSIWYKCDIGYGRVKVGKVVCNSGKWEGPTPACSDFRCHMSELNYPGLVKPQVDFVRDTQSFVLTCAKGYDKSSLNKHISCLKGEWDLKVNPCIKKTCEEEPPTITNGKPREFTRENGSVVDYDCDKDYKMVKYSSVHCAFGEWQGEPPECRFAIKDSAAKTTKETRNNSANAESLNTASNFSLNDDCFCTYDYDSYYIKAGMMDAEIGYGRIKKGERLLFACKYPSMDIVWPNGLRFFEKMELVCDTCQDWQRHDLPQCQTRETGDSFILFESKFKIIAGGIIEVPKSEKMTITCLNFFLQPKWYVTPTENIFFQENHAPLRTTGMYIENITINEMSYEHIGRYECFAIDNNLEKRSTVLDLKISESEILCPELSTETNLGSFEIVYSDKRKINSVARYGCKDPLKEIVGPSERKCLENKKWSHSFPACRDIACLEFSEDSDLSVSYSNGTKVNSIASFSCLNHVSLVGSTTARCLSDGTWDQPKPSCESSRCPKLLQTNALQITFTNRRKINSVAMYRCKKAHQRLIGTSNRTCLYTGEWSGTAPVCEDITCLEFQKYNGLFVSYSNGTKVYSIASFSCLNRATLVGSSTARCLSNGTWDQPKPSCEILEIHCPKLDGKGIFNIQYSNNRTINSTAVFFCKALNKKVAGCNFFTCQQNGEWSPGDYPTCVDYVTCDLFKATTNLHVSYTDGGRVGSVASFECLPTMLLSGSSYATCLSNGSWSNFPPICKASDCSIDTLSMILPDSMYPDMINVTSELVTPGSKVGLVCADDLIINGPANALCNNQGKWDFSDVQCISACRVIKNETSHLTVEPEKDYYGFGEFIVLSCPPGQELTNQVQKMVCLGKSWSDSLPDCTEVTETELSETTLKSG